MKIDLRAGAIVLAGAIVTAAALGAVVAAVAPRARPFPAIARDQVVLFVSNCRFSVATFKELERTPAKDAPVIAVPIAGAAPEVAAAICRRTLPVIERRAPWLKLLPEQRACRSLTEDATAFYEQHFVRTPALSVGRLPIPPGAHQAALSLLGIDLRHEKDGTRLFRRRSGSPTFSYAAVEPGHWITQSIGW